VFRTESEGGLATISQERAMTVRPPSGISVGAGASDQEF